MKAFQRFSFAKPLKRLEVFSLASVTSLTEARC